ncbi:2650_t:CDS:2 [Ambispora gerdemannii]|uniref:2650_t:CDS:1 n=1 Tax=Ambispora gerdemannii TaxID=144530 RepID=A0A9N9AG38_9GLOM|nr:2650_t:CDS:2 [Ambispora gerdemannii]
MSKTIKDVPKEAQPYMRLRALVDSKKYTLKQFSAEWALYHAGLHWQEGLLLYSKIAVVAQPSNDPSTSKEKDENQALLDSSLAYLFKAIILSENISFISASAYLVPSLFLEEKPLNTQIGRIIQTVSGIGSHIGAMPDAKFTSLMWELLTKLEASDTDMEQALTLFTKSIMSIFLWAESIKLEEQVRLFQRGIIFIAAMRKLLALKLPDFIAGFAIQALNGIPVSTVIEGKPLPSLTAKTQLSDTVREKILKKAMENENLSFLLSLELISVMYFRSGSVLLKMDGVKPEAVKVTLQWALDLLDASKNPEFAISPSLSSSKTISVENDNENNKDSNLNSTNKQSPSLVLSIPIHTLYRSDYLYYLCGAIFNLKQYQQAKWKYLDVAKAGRDQNRVTALEALYSVPMCIALGADSVKDPTTFDVEEFRKAAKEPDSLYNELKEEGIWLEMLESNQKNLIIQLLESLPEKGSSPILLMEGTDSDESRDFSFLPQDSISSEQSSPSKNNSKKNTTSETLKNVEQNSRITLVKCAHCQKADPAMQCPCKQKAVETLGIERRNQYLYLNELSGSSSVISAMEKNLRISSNVTSDETRDQDMVDAEYENETPNDPDIDNTTKLDTVTRSTLPLKRIREEPEKISDDKSSNKKAKHSKGGSHIENLSKSYPMYQKIRLSHHHIYPHRRLIQQTLKHLFLYITIL